MKRRNFLKALFLSPIMTKSALANKFTDIPSLFSEIQKYSELSLENEVGFKSIYMAGDEKTEIGKQIIQNSKTIILIGDVHYRNKTVISKDVFDELSMYGFKIEQNEGWKIEQKQLDILNDRFGINFVGIEGWAGLDSDKKRGRRILNGEYLLIEDLLNNSKFNIIGLEELKSQILALEVFFFLKLYNQYIFYHSRIITSFNKKYSTEHILKFIKDLELIIFDEPKDLTKVIYIKFLFSFFNETDLNKNTLDLLNKFIDQLTITKKQYQINNFIEINYYNIKKHRIELHKKFGNNYREYGDILETHKTMHDDRSIFAAKKFLNEMTKQNQSIGAIVFGKLHLKRIQKELIKLTNGKINIYIAK
jgi:hypothetical protein